MAFCEEEDLAGTLTPANINTLLVARFIQWLSQKHDDGSYVYEASTRSHRYGVLVKVIRGLIADNVIDAEDVDIPVNPWSGVWMNRPKDPEEALSPDDLFRFYRICKSAMADTIQLVRKRWAQEKAFLSWNHGKNSISQGDLALGRTISHVKEVFGAALPERQQLKHSKHELFEDLNSLGYSDVLRSLGPYAADLCPFVYYLIMVTGFSLQALVDTKASDIIVRTTVGRTVVILASVKNRSTSKRFRSGKPIRSSYVVGDDPMSPANIILFLLDWTRYIRENSDHPYVAYLFVMIPRNRRDATRIETYAHEGMRQSKFQRHTTQFCGENDFPWIGFRRLRDAVAEQADEMFHGNEKKVGVILHHAKVQTTQDHYQNARVRARQQRAFAKGFMLRERWFLSGGHIEPRNVDADQDNTAATVGFRCLDTTSSPQPMQREGRPCTAYGACPACPLAMVDIESDYAAACCMSLKSLYENARLSLGHAVFAVRWAQNYDALKNIWLPAFSSNVLSRAMKRHLPTLPELE